VRQNCNACSKRGSARGYDKRVAAGFPDHVTSELAAFIAELDAAFIATVSAEGAPYIQHRGGPKGFIKVLDDTIIQPFTIGRSVHLHPALLLGSVAYFMIAGFPGGSVVSHRTIPSLFPWVAPHLTLATASPSLIPALPATFNTIASNL